MTRLLSVLLACLCIAACSKTEPVRVGKPALWEITGPRGEAKGWLFGTVHALPANVHWSTPALDRAVGQAGVLVVEVGNLADTNAIARTFKALATNDPGPPLEQRLDPGQRSRLDALLSRDDVDVRRFDAFETWGAALAIAQLDQTGDAANGADRVLLRRFEGRPIAELEGAKAQLSIFDRLPPRDQRDLLMGVIEESETGPQDRARLADAWLAGDLEGMEALTRQGILAYPDLYQSLLAQRNLAWAHKIAAQVAAGRRPFVAVGAAHMLGKDGLPALLSARGFTVHRVQ